MSPASSRPTRIAFVTSVFPVPWDLTRGRPVFETAKALGEIADVEVFFTTARYPRHPRLQPRGYIYGTFPPDYSLPGVRMQAFDYPALPLVSRPFNGWVAQQGLRPRLAAFDPDVVLAYWIYPEGYAALRVAQGLGKPCVIGSRGSDIRVRDRISSHYTGLALREATEVLTVSEELRQQAIERYGAAPERVTTLVNGCNTALFHPRERSAVRAGLGVPEAATLITFVGRIVQAKGVAELVQAFARIAAERPQARLALVGDGVYREALDAQIAALGLADRVHRPGAVQPQEVALWLAASDAMTLPSYSEGYPNVVVEALASGVPVVATDVGGTREIVDAGCGELIQPRDVDGLATALGRVLDGVAAGRYPATTLAARFGRSWADVASQTLEVCDRARARAGQGG
jgi:glycosyltransferase involved in cell wall biosynthesis